MSSSYVPLLMKDEEPRNWAELPSELTSFILNRLSMIDILENVQKVCKPWRRVCKDLSMWRKIDMSNLGDFATKYDLMIMCRHAVDLSQGGLVDIDIWDFGTDDLLYYIAERSINLRSLRFAYNKITDEGVMKAVVKLPLLEELDVILYCSLSGNSMRVVGQSCPNLKTLRLNHSPKVEYFGCDESNSIATEIAECMPKLRHLQLIGDGLNNTGLNAILDGCPYLDHLDLRECSNINLVGDLEKKCSKRISVLRCPYDSTADLPFQTTLYDLEWDFVSDCGFDNDVDFEFSCTSPSDYYRWY
ncbi:PREDICTED: putative F-box/LRR-repeat protein 23 [Camelina sativa]|uniref:F-box/LRR-repeat protein 23 n=1 Tax=Camelina sativa TaxID=90675 RepID=A0ABM0U3I1_CAMSA|nr:PREDICTED: putative F-box/LRR-repeat protein 23 [Camelina sativa]